MVGRGSRVERWSVEGRGSIAGRWRVERVDRRSIEGRERVDRGSIRAKTGLMRTAMREIFLPRVTFENDRIDCNVL
jgi:hypothetical protein